MIKQSIFIALAASMSVIGAYAEEEKEAKPLAASVALGATVNSGNTDNSLGNVSLTLDYNPDEKNVYNFGADWAYGEDDGDKTTEKGKTVAGYKRIFSERTFYTLNGSAEYDDIADLDYRWVVSPGIGNYLMKDDASHLFVEVGPGLIGQKQSGIDEGTDIILRAAEAYERVTETGAKYWQGVEYLPRVDDFGNYILNAEIGAEAPMSESLNIRLVVKDTYNSDPPPGIDENDFTFIAAIAYSLL